NVENAVVMDESMQATAIFTGEVVGFEKKVNHHTGNIFYWFMIETLGARIDVVADRHFFPEEPIIGGFVHGSFWLSGRIVTNGNDTIEKKGFLNKFFG
ncbi:MAG: hypothetical protein WBA74_19230, partial [Cyclobacteriaceae bacterium]